MDIEKLPPGQQLPLIRQRIRVVLMELLKDGVRPWVISQALVSEANDFEKVTRTVDPLRELEG